MYNHTYSYNVNPQKRRFCSDNQGTPITELPTFYFGERPVFTMTFPDNVLTEGEKLVFVMDNENRFLDSHSITGLEPVMAWCIHEITAEDVENKSIELELYCFSRKYADVINGHDNAVTCTLSLFIKSLDDNLKCTFSTLATTLAYAEPTIVSPDCVFNDLPIDMYLTRDEMNALIAEVEALQREAIEKAEQAQQSAQEAKEAADSVKDLKPLILTEPPTTSTVGVVGKLGLYRDSTNKDHLYHLVFISTSETATLYHWEECVLVSQGNAAGGYPVLDENGKVENAAIPNAGNNNAKVGGVWIMGASSGYYSGLSLEGFATYGLRIQPAFKQWIDSRAPARSPITPDLLDYAVRSVLPNVTEIPAATSDYSLVDSSATTLNHSHTFVHTPASVPPTYRLPAVNGTTISHYIELTVDFTNVQTYSFLDYQGEPIVPLFTPAIAAGDVYTFRMEYSNIKAAWLIYPQKQGAVADDFVMRGEVGAVNGVAGLDGNGKLQSSQLPVIIGTTAPTTSTVGFVSQLYVNTVTGKTYHCTAITNTGTESEPMWSYTWTEDINAKGGRVHGPLSVSLANNPKEYGFEFVMTTNENAFYLWQSSNARMKIRTDTVEIRPTSSVYIASPTVNVEGLRRVQYANTVIPSATTAYTLTEGVQSHTPSEASVYTLPAVTNNDRTHEIILIIDFINVQTFEFIPPHDSGVTFQSYANPNQGDVWVFRCVWYGGKWRIAPMKIKNCVTRQLTSGALSITDAVAGDALALKMTASRSVVLNQHIDTTDTSVTLTNGKTWLTYIGGVSEKVTGTGQSVACIGGTDMAVDLTQYFNGDSTLINSITSWDDLVAYDPRFAQYVEYNTGMVTGVTPQVKVTGKNLFDKDNLAAYAYTGSVTVVDGRNCIVLHDKNVTSGQMLSFKFPSPMTVAVQMYVRRLNLGGNSIFRFAFRRSDGTSYDITRYGDDNWALHTVNGTNIIQIDVFGSNYAPHRTYVDVDTIQLELGSVATAYEPYHGGGTATAPEELFGAGATLGDSYDAISGVTTHVIDSYTITGNETWDAGSMSGGDFAFGFVLPTLKDNPRFVACPGYVYGGNYWTTMQDKSVAGSVNGSHKVWFRDSVLFSGLTHQDIATAKALMTGKTVYYELAEPTTSTSTPTQITLQAGNNTAMQTDGGRLAPIDITYESDEL